MLHYADITYTERDLKGKVIARPPSAGRNEIQWGRALKSSKNQRQRLQERLGFGQLAGQAEPAGWQVAESPKVSSKRQGETLQW